VRVLNVNKFHYRRAGAETVYFDTARLLAAHGHEVVPFAMQHPQNEPTPWSRFFPSYIEFRAKGGPAERLARAGRVLYSLEARDCMRRVLAEARPDLVHLHNYAHQLSPSILDAMREARVPVVQTLHDYKSTCPVYQHRTPDGEVCERCLGGRYYHCVVHRCNAGSLPMSLVNAAEMTWHRLRGSFDAVDVFICPSRFEYAKLLESGVARARLAEVPHYVFAQDFQPCHDPGGHALFAGRLSPEKGLATLLEALARVPGCRLVLAGDGPQRAVLEARVRELGIGGRTRFAGHLTGAAYDREWQGAAFLVLPSELWEVRPMVIHEAYARGKPVLSTRIGSIPEIVRDGETGRLVAPRDPGALAAGLAEMSGDAARLAGWGRAARLYVETELTPERHWAALEGVYRRALERHGRQWA
jgi:glycosyltransferase involved in cell wall biosynthesis